jgi:hypothetical protein
MNIFVLSNHPETAALFHCDQHVVKMATEYAQILSTAHRLCDGVETTIVNSKGRKQKVWILSDPEMNSLLLKATHYNHPCCVWARTSLENYMWLYLLYYYTVKQYNIRYGKQFKYQKNGLLDMLDRWPNNLPVLGNLTQGRPTEFVQCMPEDIRIENDPVRAYREFYIQKKSEFARWTRGINPPEWYTNRV